MVPSDEKFSNAQVCRLLREVAAAYEVTGQDRFRIRAYDNAATAIEHATSEAHDLWKSGQLSQIPGIGASLSGHLDEYFRTGRVKHFDQVLKPLPQGMFELLGLHGIGSKTAFKLAEAFKLKDRDSARELVLKAAQEGKIRLLEGFGELKEKEILEAVAEEKPNKEARGRILLPDATEIAERYLKFMLREESVLQIEPLGSLRRRVATIGDIDFAVASTEPKKVIDHFVSYTEIKEILNQGDIKASVLLKNGVRVDLEIQSPDSFGSLLQHFTGSKAHNIALRTYALEKGLSLSEHGIKKAGKMHTFEQEEQFYNFIGVPYIPPELREDAGELQAGISGKLPDLIDLKDIKGDLHAHTVFSDGENSLEEMVQAAAKLGYSYFGISDHAPSIANRGEEEVISIVEKTKSTIEHINSSYKDIRVLYGYEVNILADGSISMPDRILKKLDYAIGSIHTSFKQSRVEITDRLLKAIRNPYITFIAHPSGRLLNQRNAYEADWELIFAEAIRHKKILEINAHPERLDLPDVLVREAVEKGVKLIINTDAHAIEQLGLMRYGIDIARRGWAEKSNVINTLPLSEFLQVFLRKG